MKGKIVATVVATMWLQAAGALAQTQVCVPQFLDGNAGEFQWRTTLVLQNQNQAQAQVRLSFYDNNGTPMYSFEMERRGGPAARSMVGPGGQFDPEPIRARAAVGYQSAGQGPLQAGYVMIQSQSRLQVHAMLQLHDATGNVVSEAIVVPGQPFNRAGFFADGANGVGIGLALANTSADRAAACTLELIDLDGVTVLASTPITIGPHSQTARFLFELFPEILDGGVGLVRVSCSDPVCALALRLRGLAMAQIPVVIED